MKKVINFLKNSNHWKHLVGGFAIGAASGDFYRGMYATLTAASSLELKDHLYGNSWDWVDWTLTMIGGALGSSIWLFIKH